MRRFGLGLTAALVVAFGIRAEGALDGNWIVANVNSASEANVAIIKIAIPKGGKPDAAIVLSPANVESKVADVKVTDSTIAFTIHQSREIQNRKINFNYEFVFVRGKDNKTLLGSSGTVGSEDRFRN